LGPTILRATDPPVIGILAKTIIGDVFMKNMSDPAAGRVIGRKIRLSR